MKISYPFFATVHQDGEYYIAICPELDITSQGKTLKTAVSNLQEAVESYLGEKLPEGFSRVIVY